MRKHTGRAILVWGAEEERTIGETYTIWWLTTLFLERLVPWISVSRAPFGLVTLKLYMGLPVIIKAFAREH